jgi:dihydroorotate dehydrogenase (fumarate)
MADLSVNYAGLKLKNPLIVSSSGLTNSVSKILRLQEKGAGAVVLKSLFEEQINYEAGSMMQQGAYPEAEDYLMNYVKNNSIESYLNLIEESKKQSDIPVIASINCISAKEWTTFAGHIEEAGADALELNVYFLPNILTRSAEKYENLYFDLLKKVKSKLNIPVIMKIGQNFTSLPAFVNNLAARGAAGVVLFNRFYAPDIDLNSMSLTAAEIFSTKDDMRYTLRWIGILSSLLDKTDLCASTGIHDGEGIVKMLLAGATAIQMCSSIYVHGADHITKSLNDLQNWMDKNEYESIDEFRGKLNYKHIKDSRIFERSQFMRYFSDTQ